MAKLLSDLRSTAQRHCGPAELLAALNGLLDGEARRGMFVTLQYLLLDGGSGTVLAANAGHVPLLHYRARTGAIDTVDLPGGPPLGILEPVTYPETRINLEPGDRLVLLTDGVTEATNPQGEAFGWDRLTAAVDRAARTGGSLVERVMEAVAEFTAGGTRRDDLTLLELRWCG
jgi:sigma-B regulation protein RsbU (phosphoserine phosphatase)